MFHREYFHRGTELLPIQDPPVWSLCSTEDVNKMLAVVAAMAFIAHLGAALDHAFLGSEILDSSLSRMAAYV